MKKILLGILICIVLLVVITGGFSRNGKVSEVNIIPKSSKIYSDNEIDSAINVILKYFKQHFNGCSLLEITYIGDEKNTDYQEEWAEKNNIDEVIVLTSSFSVDSSGVDGSFNPNSKYEGWKWILVKNENGTWKHVDHGY